MVFVRLRQCALPPNTCFLVPTRSPNPKLHLDRFICFCTAHGRELLHFNTGRPFPLKIASSYGDLTPLNARFLRPTRVLNLNGISIGSVGFTQLTAERTYALQWVALPHSKLPIPMVGSGPQSNNGPLGPSEPITQTVSRSVQPFLYS